MMRAAWAIVTGPSRGIGRATALCLAQRGLRLALVGRPSAELDQARELCLQQGAAEARVFAADLADARSTHEASRALLALDAPPGVIVHNAGVVQRAEIESLTEAAWNEQVQVNLSAPFLLTRALLPAMRRAGRGRIRCVGSISSTLGTAKLSAYCATKWGIVGFMKSLAAELSDSGLMSAAVLPGSVATRMLEGSDFPARMSAEEVAATLTFLALDAPLSHNGAVVEMFGV
ncbi:MAG TPA: SDR family oxidoreductase [Polyangiaceae bacterium]|nr:SDR family oxidoreductase [Polyangiaceae bacterium]